MDSRTSVIVMPTEASLEESIVQLERGVFAASAHELGLVLEEENSLFGQTPLWRIRSTTSCVVIWPGFVTL
jgi:hypothetical protein